MKKKLLTVLLAVVMVFGVFSLTACGAGTNPDSEYNYYGTKYSLEGDVKIEAATFQGVYKMFTTAGNFLLYIDSESDGAAARFQAINKLAQDWDVTIYHFNPDLSGGYANQNGDEVPNILGTVAAGSQLEDVQATLAAISKNTKFTDNTLYAVKGAESTNSGATLVYNGSVASYTGKVSGGTTATNADVIASIALKRPSYAQYAGSDGKANIPEAFNTENINTMNLFADNRLHMYNDDGTDALTEEKTDVYVTVANYGQFAYLMDNNEGYFAVFFGGTWCPNTQAIAMLTNDLAKDYGIERIYFFDPRLDDGTKVDAVSKSTDENGDPVYTVVENSAYLASNLNSRNSDASVLWNNLTDANELSQYISTAKSAYVKEVQADSEYAVASTKADDAINAGIVAEVTKTVTNYADLEAQVKKGYTEEAWGKLDALEQATAVVNEYNKTATTKYDINAGVYNVILAALATENAEMTQTVVEAAAKANYEADAYNYNYLYARFLNSYLSDYKSEWNYGTVLTIDGESYTKMCVPNMMMFNGEGQGKAELVGLAEAEYTYANTSVEGNPQNVEWTNAIKAIFDKDPYAYYAPLPEPVEETATAETGSTSSSSSSSSSAASSDAGGC